jgi:hypothetical protein
MELLKLLFDGNAAGPRLSGLRLPAWPKHCETGMDSGLSPADESLGKKNPVTETVLDQVYWSGSRTPLVKCHHRNSS